MYTCVYVYIYIYIIEREEIPYVHIPTYGRPRAASKVQYDMISYHTIVIRMLLSCVMFVS